ncbi:MAG TPA: hypothetical protein VI140_11425 [Oxalicibacterium sp.]
MRRRNRFCFTAVLAVLLLFAQWMGLQHSIAHADLIDGNHAVFKSAKVADASGEYVGDKGHSCKLYDSATLSDSAPLPIVLPVIRTGMLVATQHISAILWDAPLLCHFSSRAPPRA